MTILKVTALLLMVFLLNALLRHRTPALRHFIWTLGLAGTIALTAIAPWTPELVIPVPAMLDRATPMEQGFRAVAERLTAPASRSAGMVNGYQEASALATASAPEVPSGTVGAGPIPIEWLLPLVYLFGAATVIGWYLLGRVALRRLVRHAEELTGDGWPLLLREIAASAGVSRVARVYRSNRVGSPITWGIRRPVILLPADASQWTEARRRIVLAHELAHAARGDHLSQLIGVIACAIYWFHPLVWLALRRLAVESERAADDHVLSRGASGIDYAGHLLDIARRSRHLRRAGLAAIGMARPSQLEGRLIALLDDGRDRGAPRAGFMVAAWTGLMFLVVPASAARFEPAAPPVEPLPRATNLAVTRPAVAPAEPVRRTADSLIERSVEARAGETLVLNLETGGDITIRGWDRPQVRVIARLSGDNWRDTRISIERIGEGVEVRSEPVRKRNQFSTSHDFEIMVPERYNVRLESAGGGMTIVGVDGVFRGETGGGELNLERARGEARLSTGGGDIVVMSSDLRGSVSTGGGSVTLSAVKGGLKGSSGSGPVIYADAGGDRTGDLNRVSVEKGSIRLRDARPGVLYVRKAGGDIILDGAPDGAEVNTGGGEIRIGRSGGTIDASTGGGNITIGPVAGSVRAGTGAGRVEVSITPAEGKEQSVDVSAGVGAVVIDWPEGVPARFELETAYTRNFGRRTRIETDLGLSEEETDEWDRERGTPRKYVRAYGSIGNGGGLVRVRTVNGDITIRRTPNGRR